MKGLRPRGGKAWRKLSPRPCRVPFFPGRGTARAAPDVKIFYTSRVRAAFPFWRRDLSAPKYILRWIRHGVKFQWIQGRPPLPFSRAPKMVEAPDIDFVISKIQDGIKTGAHGPIPPGQAKWLAPAHVVLTAGKRRLVVNHRDLNDSCEAASCKYENIDDLVGLLSPKSYLLSADLVAAYHHVPVATAHQRYTGFHFALPARTAAGKRVPLQPGGYWVYPSQLAPSELASARAACRKSGANVAFPAGIAHSQFRAPGRQINFQSGTLEEEPIYQVVQLQALALDFGARASPLTFTKFMKSIGSYLRRQRIGTVIYIDDLAFIVEGYEEALRARTVIEDTLQRAGLEKHATKGQWQPSQVLNDHLGYEVNVPANALRIPERRCATIRRLAVALRCEAKRGQRFVPTRLLQQFTGTAQSTSKAVPRCQFHLRALYDCTALARERSKLTRQALHDLDFWAQFHYNSSDNGIPLWRPASTRVLYTDASGKTGWGGVIPDESLASALCAAHAKNPHMDARELHEMAQVSEPQDLWKRAQTAQGTWDVETQDTHVNFKELRAVAKSVRVWQDYLRGHQVLLFCDNTTTVQLLRKGVSRSPLLMAEVRQLWQLLIVANIKLVPVYIKSELNPADAPSRFSITRRAEWTFTAGARHRLIKLAPSTFTLDPFASAETGMADKRCSLLSTPPTDGFAQPWKGEYIFLNPPWRDLDRVLRKIRQEQAAGVLVLPWWPTRPWWSAALQLRARWVCLPPPHACVKPLVTGTVEPFANRAVRLWALVFDGTR